MAGRSRAATCLSVVWRDLLPGRLGASRYYLIAKTLSIEHMVYFGMRYNKSGSRRVSGSAGLRVGTRRLDDPMTRRLKNRRFALPKPIAVIRRDIIASTGPSIYGTKRMDRVISPTGERFTFLGVCDGICHLEREDKTTGPPFTEVDSEEFAKWKKG